MSEMVTINLAEDVTSMPHAPMVVFMTIAHVQLVWSGMITEKDVNGVPQLVMQAMMTQGASHLVMV